MNKILTPFIAFFLTLSCTRDPNPVFPDLTDSYLSGSGVFILNEGQFRSGNGSLSFFSNDSARIFNNVFLKINKRLLGDVPYSMSIMGDNAYIVVNNSAKIEITKRNDMESVATISGLSSPRYISLISSTKAYVTSLDSDSLTIINLENNSISGYINIKGSSESIIDVSGKAFIARWVGGNKIMVVNTVNDMLIDSIDVAMEPESMVTDKNGTVWVLCNGGWTREYFAELIAINPMTYEITKRFVFPSKNDSPTCLQIDGKGENLFFLKNGVRKMSINASELPPAPFIAESERLFYKLGINPLNGDIFITDAVDYQVKGYVLRFGSNGSLTSVNQADIIPGAFCFKVTPDPVIE